LLEDEKILLNIEESDNLMKWEWCRCVPCIWIQKGHLVQRKH
jgi:hypothetical protein